MDRLTVIVAPVPQGNMAIHRLKPVLPKPRQLPKQQEALTANQEIRHPLRQGAIRRTQQSERGEAALQEYALLLRESQEAVEAVIRSHAAGTHSAERQIILRDVQDRVVHR